MSRQSEFRHRLIYQLYCISILASSFAVMAFYSSISRQLVSSSGLSYSDMANSFHLFTWSGVAGTLLTGWLCLTVSWYRLVAAAGLMLIVASGIAIAFSTAFTFWLFVSLVGLAVGMCGYTIIGPAILAKGSAKYPNGKLVGLFLSAKFSSFLFGVTLGGFFAEFGYPYTLMPIGLLGVIVMALAISGRSRDVDTDNPMRPLGEPLGHAFQQMIKCPRFRIAAICVVTLGLTVWPIHVHLPNLMLGHGWSFPLWDTSSLIISLLGTPESLIGLTGVIGLLLIAGFGDRFRQVDLLVAGFTGQIVAIFVLMIAPASSATLLFVMVGTVWWWTFLPILGAFLFERIALRYLALVFASLLSIGKLASMCGVLMFGYFFEYFGSYDAVLLISMFICILFNIYLVIIKLKVNI